MRMLTLFAMFVAALSVLADDNAPAAIGGPADEAERPGESNISHNYLVNGSFDDPDFQQRELKNYDGVDVAYDCSSLLGWAVETAGVRNGIVEILSREDTDGRYARMRHYTLDGWARITLTAKATGLVPGHEYMLDMYVCHSYVESNYWANPDHGFKIYGEDGKLLNFNHSISTGDDWQYLRYAFTPDGDEITLELWSQNYN
ncbi:MAG: hypothetical protein K2N16_09670, partial [Muribaculaceae bacterium]|nr:hypothetical protein [Muribaculaceae bacterium]